MNLCRPCGLDFGSVRAFDAHRVGKHAYTFTEGMRKEPPTEDGRRCLDVHEMRSNGFAVNALGRWSLEESIARGEALRREVSAREALAAGH